MSPPFPYCRELKAITRNYIIRIEMVSKTLGSGIKHFRVPGCVKGTLTT